ncbi:MAG TPA: hypothetical protein VGN63_01615 [Flavisolibacter sp.]|jgi:hypothetical protein|nr:hypothetical protein [Flavisolibacter sp.]
MNHNEENKNSQIPENDPSKAMDSKREVAKSPDEKTDQDFPGYPHYPAKEDIMDKSTGSHRVDANVEQMGTGPNKTGVSQRYMDGSINKDSSAGANDRTAGESATAGLDGENDEIGLPQNVSNRDLENGNNIPGSDIDEAAEKGSTNP